MLEITVLFLSICVFIQGWMISTLNKRVSNNVDLIITLQKVVLGLCPDHIIKRVREQMDKEKEK